MKVDLKQKFKVVLVFILLTTINVFAQQKPAFSYTVSFPDTKSKSYHVELNTSGWNQNSVQFKMPRWMPGYYQIMDYGKNVYNISAIDNEKNALSLKQIDDSTWEISGVKNQSFKIMYDVKTTRKFVAMSFVDENHGYLIGGNSFLYVDGFINEPVRVKVLKKTTWSKIATGLELVKGTSNEFIASDFDILYDSPILIGDLEELQSFKVYGVEHHFIGYKMGDFDKKEFIKNLQSVVKSAADIIGDIPFKKYTFIAIGPGRGGIEHLNNTTVSFDGSQLKTKAGMNKMMNFLAHEYFHHYNVKRIRPIEVGPFDYAKGSKTNLLWISEGLSVYYEYLMVKRAGLSSDKMLFQNFENNINTFENNPGRKLQSLTQASYETWKDGPMGNFRKGETISYYEKGPIVGLLLDFAIRNATENKKSLDDVMRFLYREYYKKKQRGFSDAEFQQACETIAGASLKAFFEYIYTTKELDYKTYLSFGGLKLEFKTNEIDKKKEFTLSKIENPTGLQQKILKSWLGE
ncbi:hypothetical protein KCTC32516_01304 [Polaribacter huanghezhanensis]|uniref:M61 family metallopeptidase n=1 Tax=Polaribacter huanghezhanensis TaxID=1354726 RepID=UPI0026479D6E|nr:hypothetical protein [Polaribacter huanghezhanensis]WKD85955.1 hypothetical protein KCTC32516_01304 [Polaribacter huanghezhanensis]